MASFRQRALALIRAIPPGSVMGYGDVAAALGEPRAARQVGYALADLPAGTDVPWHRVLRSSGHLAMNGDLTRPLLQRARLEAERVPFVGDRVDIERCRHVPESAVILLYELLATLATPLVALLLVLHPRLRGHLRERLGYPELVIPPGALWLHGASVGEGRALAALLGPLRAAARGVPILRTCTSAAARALTATPEPDQTLCLPVDLPWAVSRWLDRVRPRALLLAEADLWPALLQGCRRRGIPVLVVQARVAAGQERLLRSPLLFRSITRGIRFLCPDEPTALRLGGEVVGDLKAAAPPPPLRLRWSRPALVAGSTWEGEEEALLRAVRQLDPAQRPLLVLAPRQPARFEAVAEWLATQPERSARRSELGGGREARVPPEVEVLLLDSLGELGGLYGEAVAAFVGGTFRPEVGGHSPAEAFAAGCPLLRGPHIASNAAAWSGVPADVAERPEDLVHALRAALARPRSPARASEAVDRVMAVLATAGPAGVPLWEAPVPAEGVLRPWLLPLGWAWMTLVTLRRPRSVAAPIPVVAVGALTAGGAGKTPVSAELARWLRRAEPAVVARGYRRDAGADARVHRPGSGEPSAARLGDELAMLARRGIPVVSCPDRLLGVEAAAKSGAKVAILDDALQHRQLRHDVEVLCVDARWPLGGGPLPAGLRRAPLSRLADADIIWSNHGPPPPEIRRHLRKDAVVVEARYRPAALLRHRQVLPLEVLSDPEVARAADVPLGRPVGAFCAIARPEGFFQLLRDLGLPLRDCWSFPDHHRFSWADLQQIESWLDDRLVFTTEKDLARLPPELGVMAVRLRLEVVAGEAEARALLGRRVGAGATLGGEA